MRKVKVVIKGKKMMWDYDRFPGDECDREEKVVRAILAKLGVKTDVKDSEKKPEEGQQFPIVERTGIHE